MSGELALKEQRAAELRRQLSGLRADHTNGLQAQSDAVQSSKLDDEIAQLERQVAIEKERAASGGSIVDAMEAMAAAEAAEAADAEAKQALLAVSLGVKTDEVPVAPVVPVESNAEVVATPVVANLFDAPKGGAN